MTNLKKWKIRIAEAEDGRELLETLDEMEKDMTLSCGCYDCMEYDADCDECKARWLDMEAEE